MKELPRERLIMAIGGVISMELALQGTIDYVKSRKAFGKHVIEFQNTQFKLAECTAQATVAKVFVNDCIDKVLRGELDNTLSAIAKMWVTDVECKIMDECLQLHGGYGYIKDYQVERYLRDLRVHRILEGTNEIMRVIIARKLLEAA
jgi:alkylation response protein AidB-like acyl-CoA dehydrogenase